MGKSIFAALISGVTAVAFAPTAFAQTPTLQSAWVSGQGSDVATCGAVTTPCRTFQYTHDNIVIAGGQIRVHDPAGYSALTITKAISIINDGVGVAGISAPTGSAITINAPNAAVFLKGLSLDGAGTGTNGVNVLAASGVIVTNATITGFNNGLYLDVTATVNLIDSFVSNNAYGVRSNVNSLTSIFIRHNNIFGNTNEDIACGNFTTVITTNDNVFDTILNCGFSSYVLK